MYAYAFLGVEKSLTGGWMDSIRRAMRLKRPMCGINVPRGIADDCECSVGSAQHAAIEEALLLSPLPSDKAILVAPRPDLDSVGAMAVLFIRERYEHRYVSGSAPDVMGWLESAAAIRIRSIADRSASADFPLLAGFITKSDVALADRVRAVAWWIITGEVPDLAPGIRFWSVRRHAIAA